MQIVLITALGVGGATCLGAIIGLFFKTISHKSNDIILSFAAGIMLAASVFGLIMPSIEKGNSVFVTSAGILIGAFFLSAMDKIIPHIHNLTASHNEENHKSNHALDKIMLFVGAIAIHNLPEGIAAGVGFGTGDMAGAITVAAGIALQNIPEGMIVIAPLLSAGVSKRKALLISFATGLVEVVGTFIGYFSSTMAASVLPFALAFAGGTMLYVISDEMIPETHSHGYEKEATYTLLLGFIVMLIMDFYL